jgi:hypothetical protein
VVTTVSFTEAQTVYKSGNGDTPRYLATLSYQPYRASTVTGAVTPPGVHIRVSWPALAAAPEGWVESYTVFPQPDEDIP